MRTAGALITIIDFHAEATSEKKALAYFLDGRLGALVGTHTHVQTNDVQILPGGLAYVTDLGMTGASNSVIGMGQEETIASFLTGRNFRFKPAKGVSVMEGVIIDFDDLGKATDIRLLSLPGTQE
jgi:calcineurin-like phosphoesterase